MSRHTKYFLVTLAELASGETEAMNVNLPMNTPLMLVRRAGRLEIKRLRKGELSPRIKQPAPPEQTSLL